MPRPYVSSFNFSNSSCPYSLLLGVTFKGIGDVCPKGHFCKKKSWKPQFCTAGTYNNEVGQVNCSICPAGFFCPEGSVSYLKNACPLGYFCPLGTTRANEYPCPEGTFNNKILQKSFNACLPCSKGKFCSGIGNVIPTGDCEGGWYCNEGSFSATPLTNGGRCQPGFYCPTGSYEPIPCELGTYCDKFQLKKPSGNCSAGFYCPKMSTNSTFSACPLGRFCLEGDSYPRKCPQGYVMNEYYGKSMNDCKLCPAGKYCDQPGLQFPTGDCDPGYYCPTGSVSKREKICDFGHFCVGGRALPEPCPSGEYQDEQGRTSCKICVERFFCDAKYGPVVNYTSSICPEGYFCPAGTKYATEHPCDIGTYNNGVGRANKNECLPCLAGLYCGSTGLTQPMTPCSAGYFCKFGAKSDKPREGANADICPLGFYCPVNSKSPIGCPIGTLGLLEGLTSEDNCSVCPSEKVCDKPGEHIFSSFCEPGFYCPAGSQHSKQMICPKGKYCPGGDNVPRDCPVGTYSISSGLSHLNQCQPCDRGKSCNGTGLVLPSGFCNKGQFCPKGNSAELQDCPFGLHCPEGKLNL